MKSQPLSLFYLPTDFISSLVHQTSPSSDKETKIDIHHNTSSDTLPSIEAPPTNDITPPNKEQTQLLATLRPSMCPSCRTCGVSQFESVQRQREHVKSDWHLYNLKLQLLDKEARPATEQQFNAMLLGLSIPPVIGSKNSMTKNRLLSRTATANSNNSDVQIQYLIKDLENSVEQNKSFRNTNSLSSRRRDILAQQDQKARMSPMVWFTSPLFGSSVRFAVYKNVLPNRGQCDDPVGYLKSLQFPLPSLPPKKAKIRRSVRAKALAFEQQVQHTNNTELSELHNNVKTDNAENLSLTAVESIRTEPNLEKEDTPTIASPERYWTLILLGGGHFAGAVIDLAGQSSKARSQGSHARDLKI
ncbi:hypothetical protein BGX27_001370, partial [Mortierella sp. AM989]